MSQNHTGETKSLEQESEAGPGARYALREGGSEGTAVRARPWFGLGTVITPGMTDTQIMEAAGLDWLVHLWPLKAVNPDSPAHMVTVPDRSATVRSTDHAVLGDVGAFYVPVQHIEMVEFGSVLVETTGAVWESAGSLRGGRLAFAAFRLPEAPVVAGEPLEVYLLLSTSHDASSAFRAAVTPIRPACTNMLRAILRTARSTWAIRHSGDVLAKVSEAEKALELTGTYVERFTQAAERMRNRAITVDEFEGLLTVLVQDAANPQRQAAIDVTRADALEHWLSTPTLDSESRLTRWGAWNALVEWGEHVRPLRPDHRTAGPERHFFSVWEGPAAEIRDEAFRLLQVA